MRFFGVHRDEGNDYDYRRLKNFVESHDQQCSTHQDIISIYLNEVCCDPSWLGELLLKISRIDPNFKSSYFPPGRRRTRQLSSGLEVTFRVDDHRASVSRGALGNALANISVIDPWYEVQHFPPKTKLKLVPRP
jgi:hypothetical protein